MGVFFTVYYAIITASLPIAGWPLDWTGAPDSAILVWALLFALVLPAAVLFRMLQTRAMETPGKETA